jgi:hypothetical protein
MIRSSTKEATMKLTAHQRLWLDSQEGKDLILTSGEFRRRYNLTPAQSDALIIEWIYS